MQFQLNAVVRNRVIISSFDIPGIVGGCFILWKSVSYILSESPKMSNILQFSISVHFLYRLNVTLWRVIIICLRKQETQQNQMQITAYFPVVSSNYYFEYHADFQDRELKSENVTFLDGFNGEYEKRIQT